MLLFSALTNAWWSVITRKRLPYSKNLKFSVAQAAARSSSSLTEYFCSHELKNCYAYAMVAQRFGVSCSSAAPTPSQLASHIIRVSLVLTKCLFSVIFSTAFKMFLKTISLSPCMQN